MLRKHNKQLVPAAKELRKNMTRAENHLWYDFLRAYPLRFMRQRVIGRYVVDFYCAKAKLVIEIDVSRRSDDQGSVDDEEFANFLAGFGIKVIRIPDDKVMQNFSAVCEYIDRQIRRRVPDVPVRQRRDDPSVSLTADSSLCEREPEHNERQASLSQREVARRAGGIVSSDSGITATDATDLKKT